MKRKEIETATDESKKGHKMIKEERPVCTYCKSSEDKLTFCARSCLDCAPALCTCCEQAICYHSDEVGQVHALCAKPHGGLCLFCSDFIEEQKERP